MADKIYSEEQTLVADLISYIRSNYLPDEKVKYAKDGGETIFFRKGGKSLCYIETKDGVSTVTVVIGVSHKNKVDSANISSSTRKMYDQTQLFHDGKWLFVKVKTQEDVEDIKTLLSIKRKL